MKYSKGMLYGVLGLILAHPAYAAVDCSSGAKPSCNDLGYTETTCSSGSYVACPYDKTKKKCIPVAPTCEDLGFTVNDKSAWCTNIVECPSNSEYTLCAWHGFEGNCEKEGYSDINEDLLCTDVFKELREGTVCVEECWSDCADAGFDRDITSVSRDVYCTGGTRTLYRHINNNIDDSTSVMCGSDCVSIYSNCEDAGLNDASECDVYGTGTTIYTSTDGDPITCYDDSSCSLWQSCADYNSQYLSTKPAGKSCQSKTITSVTGKELKCYYDCKDVTPDTSRCSEDRQSCYNNCAGVGDPSAQEYCEGHCDNDYRQCIGNTAYLLFDDLAKIKLTSVSEEFAKEKYVDALEFNEEDCTVYDS